MSEKKFNLLIEPWILVMRNDGRTEEVSMLHVFEHAHEYKGLAGELPAQDVAVLRLLLAVLHAVFSRYDNNGNVAPVNSPGEALDRWKLIWEGGAFPFKIIKKYMIHYEERFFLFHPEYPFFQIPKIGKSTLYSAAKMNGVLSESSNKIRLFPQRSGKFKQTLDFSEATRWLFYVNGFDDTASKPTKKGLLSPGTGWLGKMGIITAVGQNLFETLTLNMVLLKDGSNELWSEENPIWETESNKRVERKEIVMPDNLCELYTLQSRHLSLKQESGKVVGYELLGGDFFAKENALNEQMSMWRNTARKKTDENEYVPRRHDPSRQIWRDFPVLLGYGQNFRTPGIISWLKRLTDEQILSKNHYQFQTVAVKYGDKDFFIDDVYSDTIQFSSGLLSKFGESWVIRIINEIDTTEKMVDQLVRLARDISRASGDSDGTSSMQVAKEQAYYRIDEHFRQWLASIDPQNEDDDKDTLCDRWWDQLQRIMKSLGKDLVKDAGPQALTGKYIQDKKTGKEYFYSTPKAYNKFIYYTSSRAALNRLYKKED